jgi:nitroreductase
MNLEDIDRLLTTTPSVRKKLDLERPVEPGVVADCLRIALQAPTAGGQQTWRWIVVRDQEIRNELGKLFRSMGSAYLDNVEKRLGDAAHTPAGRRALSSGRFLVDNIERVPVLVIPCQLGRPDDGNQTLSAFYGSIFPAVWSFQLALRSRGLGSTLTTYHLTHEAEAAQILGLPANVTQVGLLPVAYTTVTDFKPAPRLPLEHVAFADRWEHPLDGE